MSAPTPRFLQNLSIPRPSSGNLRALAEADRPIAVFSDFDGTIFYEDSGAICFNKFGCGPERTEEIIASLGKTVSFRAGSDELWESLTCSIEEAIEELKKHLTLDPDFYTFFEYLEQHNIPFTVISAGVKPLLRAALDEFLGLERSAKIKIVSNDAEISPEHRWKAVWRHDSELGHDKARSVREFRASVQGPQPKVVFIGDGVSDLAAASEADILFARRGLALEAFCIENRIPYIPYDRFKDIIVDIKHLVNGNRFHDPAAEDAARKAKIAQLTGLTPLTSQEKPKPAFGLGNDDSDDDSDDEEPKGRLPKDAFPPSEPVLRPHSPPPQDEPIVPIDERPELPRHFSTGTVPSNVKTAKDKLAATQEE